jgi:UDP-N-acetylmuramyl pentapeptide phosphotransferase/UDP-N-acetylglucosamine-1-phosphate transferase
LSRISLLRINLPENSAPGMVDPVLWLTAAFATGLLSCVATRALIPILRGREILDYPNERSSHRLPTPRGGGIALIGSALLVWAALARQGLLPPNVSCVMLGGLLLAIVSWLDDLRGVSPVIRLLAQGAAVAVGTLAVPELQGSPAAWLAHAGYWVAIGLLWVWWINLFNFMDGIDGLAGSEAAAIGGGLLLFAGLGAGADADLALLAAVLTGAAVGFLAWNWSPARIFLGDVGSAPLGYLLGFLLLSFAARGHWKIALILPLYFLADATITLARRLLRGERVWQAHRDHYYQRAVRNGLNHAAVVKRVIAADLLLIGCGWAAESGWAAASLAASVAIVSVLLAALSYGR